MPFAETEVRKVLFSGRSTVTLKQENHEVLGGAKKALSDALENAYLGKLFTNNYGWSGLGLVMAIGLIGLIIACLVISHTSDQAGGLVVGILVPLVFIMGGTGLVYAGFNANPLGWGRIIFGAILAVGMLVVGFVIMSLAGRGWVEMIPGFAAYAAASVAGLGFHWLQAPSVEGHKVMDQIEGFREYLGVAEEDRLNVLNPPDKTPQLFERFLPYAIALDVENEWGKRFAGVLAAAGVAAATSTWYSVTSTNWGSDASGFASSLGGDLNSTISSASTAPGSSDGSGGGGFSGGGGGGGGGSGW